jgi:hypothetical protein
MAQLTVVSPVGPAPVAQDVSSAQVFVVAFGAVRAQSPRPGDKTMQCDLFSVTHDFDFGLVPILVLGLAA